MPLLCSLVLHVREHLASCRHSGLLFSVHEVTLATDWSLQWGYLVLYQYRFVCFLCIEMDGLDELIVKCPPRSIESGCLAESVTEDWHTSVFCARHQVSQSQSWNWVARYCYFMLWLGDKATLSSDFYMCGTTSNCLIRCAREMVTTCWRDFKKPRSKYIEGVCLWLNVACKRMFYVSAIIMDIVCCLKGRHQYCCTVTGSLWPQCRREVSVTKNQ